MTNTEFKTVRSYNTPVEAQMAQGFLASRGIESFVRDEHSVSLRPYMSQALGGVRLDVPAGQLEHAARLLNEADSHAPKLKCPKCGGEARPAADFFARGASLLASLAGMAAMQVARQKHRCVACGYEWRK